MFTTTCWVPQVCDSLSHSSSLRLGQTRNSVDFEQAVRTGEGGAELSHEQCRPQPLPVVGARGEEQAIGVVAELALRARRWSGTVGAEHAVCAQQQSIKQVKMNDSGGGLEFGGGT